MNDAILAVQFDVRVLSFLLMLSIKTTIYNIKRKKKGDVDTNFYYFPLTHT